MIGRSEILEPGGQLEHAGLTWEDLSLQCEDEVSENQGG